MNWEVGAYRPGPKGAGPDPCYAKNHGHLPGDNRYKEWKNIMGFLKKIRTRYPKVCLESYYGMHRGGPWALRHLDSAYHYYETHGADMTRLQSWHQQNDRFRPVYKNSLDLFGKNPKSFRFNVIAGLSIADYCMIGQAYPQLAAKENREFFKKWRLGQQKPRLPHGQKRSVRQSRAFTVRRQRPHHQGPRIYLPLPRRFRCQPQPKHTPAGIDPNQSLVEVRRKSRRDLPAQRNLSA
jgi:hypothetical protein